jgi:heme-degrading monooxygenase HmoA
MLAAYPLLDRNTMNRLQWAGAMTLAATASGLAAQTATPNTAESPPVVAIVKIAKPWYAPMALVRSKMRETMPQYAKLPGLDFKAFSVARPDGEFGGIYYWRDRATAQAWFNPAWFERVRQERGVEGQVRYFEAWVSIDNTAGGTPVDADSAAVATVVQIPLPAAISQERLLAEFKAAVPTYQAVPGLLRKHFITGGEGAARSFGGVYLWRDEASAKAFFSSTWQARVQSTYGAPAQIEWFDVPILLPSSLNGSATLAVQSRP